MAPRCCATLRSFYEGFASRRPTPVAPKSGQGKGTRAHAPALCSTAGGLPEQAAIISINSKMLNTMRSKNERFMPHAPRPGSERSIFERSNYERFQHPEIMSSLPHAEHPGLDWPTRSPFFPSFQVSDGKMRSPPKPAERCAATRSHSGGPGAGHFHALGPRPPEALLLLPLPLPLLCFYVSLSRVSSKTQRGAPVAAQAVSRQAKGSPAMVPA